MDSFGITLLVREDFVSDFVFQLKKFFDFNILELGRL